MTGKAVPFLIEDSQSKTEYFVKYKSVGGSWATYGGSYPDFELAVEGAQELAATYPYEEWSIFRKGEQQIALMVR